MMIKNILGNIDFSLGIRSLLPEWRTIFSTKYLLADSMAGLTVAFVAIPLSLAIALASGVSPGAGLITAIIAGIVCAFFGGTTLTVSGPAAAMAVIVADNVENFGMQGLIFICLLAGLMQLLSGMLGLGKLARFVPLPVIAGFTAGIGFIIFVGQLPRAFGLEPPPESHVFSVIQHITEYFHDINYNCFFLVLLTFVIIRGLPKLFPKVPSILPAVVFVTALVYFLDLKNIPLIGHIPSSLPTPSIPTVKDIPLDELIFSAFTVYLLASLETLLSSSAIDKITNGRKHDPSQELIGQGLGNIAASLFGGMPVTGVIARSMINVKAGAKTRRASIIHALIVLLAVIGIGPLIGMIPVAALAAVLFSIAFSMLHYKEFHWLWITCRAEAMIYALTFLTIVFFDLIAGIKIGIIAAGLIVLFRAAKTNFHISASSHDNTIRLSLSGALTFLSSTQLSKLERQLSNATSGTIVIIDLSHITNLDSSGAASIIDLFRLCHDKHAVCYIKGLSRRFERLFQTKEGKAIISKYYLVSESELRSKSSSEVILSSRGRLIHGVQRFYSERRRNDKRLFEYLAHGQDPHTLFITCSDSRIIPSQITSSDPGELFIIRNVGNYVPPYKANMLHSEAAALEFALTGLNISDVVVCGHANCGAINACCTDTIIDSNTELGKWIGMISSQLHLKENKDVDGFAKENVLNQLKNLQQYPIIKEKLAKGALHLHGWFFNFDEGMVYEWNSEANAFQPVVEPEEVI